MGIVKTASRLIWDKKQKKYIFNPKHPDYLKCDNCGRQEPMGTIDDHYCTKCFTCDKCPHNYNHRNHKRRRY